MKDGFDLLNFSQFIKYYFDPLHKKENYSNFAFDYIYIRLFN